MDENEVFRLEHGEADIRKYASSKHILGQILGVSRQTIDRWKTLPGAPAARQNGLYVVDEWRAFAQKNGLTYDEETDETGEAEGNASVPAQIQAERLRKIRLDVRKAEREAEILERTYRPVEEFAGAWTTAANLLRIAIAETAAKAFSEREEDPIKAHEHGEDLANAAFALFQTRARHLDEFCPQNTAGN